jgi:hypothetical protein
MVLNATFNNISVISCRSILLVEETGEPGENHRPVKHYHIMLYRVHLAWFELIMLVVIGTDCIGSYKSKYHTITTITAPITRRMKSLYIPKL